MSRLKRPAAVTVAMATLMVTASGCVTVHGEAVAVPTATRAEAVEALTRFTTAYNKAGRAHEAAFDKDVVTGAYGEMTKVRHQLARQRQPQGNPRFKDLQLTDPEFFIPRAKGWPRWFVADTDSNRDKDTVKSDSRWVFLFLKESAKQPWRAAHLAVLGLRQVPVFQLDADGYAEPVRSGTTGLTVPPGELSQHYTAYLQRGEPAEFASGSHTSKLRAARKRSASKRKGTSVAFTDEPLNTAAFTPLGLRTAKGGAFVFFAARSTETTKGPAGAKVPTSGETRQFLGSPAGSVLARTWISTQAAVVPAQGSSAKVRVISRHLQLTGATSR